MDPKNPWGRTAIARVATVLAVANAGKFQYVLTHRPCGQMVLASPCVEPTRDGRFDQLLAQLPGASRKFGYDPTSGSNLPPTVAYAMPAGITTSIRW